MLQVFGEIKDQVPETIEVVTRMFNNPMELKKIIELTINANKKKLYKGFDMGDYQRA